MKKIVLICTFVFMNTISAQEIIPTFLEKWENSKNYLLAMAESMPEEFYNYKPTEGQMTFGEQLWHIKKNMDWLSTTYFLNEKFDKNTSEKPLNKTETIAALRISFDKVYKIIEKSNPQELNEKVDFFAGEKSKLQMLNLLQDHVTHHRGQLIVYLNLKNIKTQKYVGW
uniref:DinB family protein n=1 Tax=Flavobacterium sp. TaxID=239 RepID=UPI00404B02DE